MQNFLIMIQSGYFALNFKSKGFNIGFEERTEDAGSFRGGVSYTIYKILMLNSDN